jgi:hypothetical protein
MEMNETPAQYYQPDERFPAAGFTLAILGGALAAFALGLAYGCIQPLMPLIYICVFIALLFATSLGYAVFAALQLGQVRHHGVATVAAVTSGLADLVGAWMGDRFVRLEMVLRRSGEKGSVAFFPPPSQFFEYVSYFFTEGFWGFRGQRLFGLPLGVIWLGEAALIVGLCVLTVRRRILETPYCEACRRWTRLTKGLRYLIPKTVRAMIDEAKRGNSRALLQVMPTSKGAPIAVRVDIAQCGGCEESTYLSLLVVSGGSKFREFVWPEEKAEVRHLKISAEDARDLRKPPKLADLAPLAPGKPRPKK